MQICPQNWNELKVSISNFIGNYLQLFIGNFHKRLKSYSFCSSKNTNEL